MPTQLIAGQATAIVARSTLGRIESPRYIAGDADAGLAVSGLVVRGTWLPGMTANAVMATNALTLRLGFAVCVAGWRELRQPQLPWVGSFYLGDQTFIATVPDGFPAWTGRVSIVPGEFAMTFGPARLAFTGSGRLAMGISF